MYRYMVSWFVLTESCLISIMLPSLWMFSYYAYNAYLLNEWRKSASDSHLNVISCGDRRIWGHGKCGWVGDRTAYITPLRKQRAMKVETILGEQFCHWLDYVWGWQHSWKPRTICRGIAMCIRTYFNHPTQQNLTSYKGPEDLWKHSSFPCKASFGFLHWYMCGWKSPWQRGKAVIL